MPDVAAKDDGYKKNEDCENSIDHDNNYILHCIDHIWER